MLENETETQAIFLELGRTLDEAKTRSKNHNISVNLALLAMLLESENERERTHGFVGKIQGLERQLQRVRLERDTFSDEVYHLKRQVDACHAKIASFETELTTRKNETEKLQLELEKVTGTANRTVCVRDMFIHVLPHQERNDRPTVPSEAAIRLQTRIDAEEFVEKIEALYDDPLVSSLGKILHAIAKHGMIRSDLHDRLPEFADALADNAVTNEGFAVLFGIDLEPVFQEVHASNMRKVDGPIVDGKRKKPEGWTPPDVVGVLRNQGWQPSIEAELDAPIQYAIGAKAMEDPSTYATCAVHQTAFDEAFGCARCENAQYNGSEIDPIGEQTGNDVYLTMKAQPIDVSIWDRSEKVEIPTALVMVPDMSIVCRVLFFNNGKDRRLMIEFLANDELFGRWERLRQDEKLCDVSVDGATLGKTKIASVERGSMRSDGSYALQIEFVKAEPASI